MPNDNELVIFTQTYDLLTWLLPQCKRFPKSQRFVVTQRLQGSALDFQEALFEANARGSVQRLQHLQAADSCLNKLRLYLRRAHQWDWLATGQYEHVRPTLL
jgi:23S rRNA-intervening sequence protein